MIDELRKNVDSEIEILREISKYTRLMQGANQHEKKMLSESINSLINSMKMINNSIPDILNNISSVQKLPSKNEPGSTGLERVSYRSKGGEISVVVNSRDKERFLRELSISESLVKKLKKKGVREKATYDEFKASRGYIKLSNKFFLDSAKGFINSGKFKPLALEIKKANLDLLTEMYVSMMFFTTALSFIGGIILAIFFFFFSLTLDPPFLLSFSGDYLIRLGQVIWIPFVVPGLTFIFLYFYPSTEKGSIAKKIERELPFAVIHMSAISGSGIAPSEIFKIIGISKEYPYLGREIRKVLNQINLYGYDLVTALNNVARATPSAKLSELFAGLTTTISSGGSLQTFFEKRAETLLNDYRLERERYTKTAETFMDIYITVVIAAPMILMLLLIMIYMTKFEIGFSPQEITLLLIVAIALINVLFLGLLQSKQPGY